MIGEALKKNSSLTKLNLEGATKALIDYCVITAISEDKIEIAVATCAKNLLTPRQKTHLQEAINSYFGKTMQFKIEVSEDEIATPAKISQQKRAAAQKAAEMQLSNDPQIEKLLNTFEGQILADTTKPLES